MPVADTIVCVDCGGTCHRLPFDPPEMGWRLGDVVTYRCSDCIDMWYLEVAEEDLDGNGGASLHPTRSESAKAIAPASEVTVRT